MLDYSKNNLQWIIDMMDVLPDGIYSTYSRMLSESTIGQHVRHIVEMYQSLLSGYESGVVEYDKRKRDRRIETDMSFAKSTIIDIMSDLQKAQKQLQIISEIDENEFSLDSNYDRELMYNLEHAIHHMALIKVAIIELTDIKLPGQFGVAPTTLQYRSQCVQ